ncbi:ParB/RepB/Spo0J family partition protein [Amedibacterium intestinale]|uniref:ParB/RepB/Spo0J family partition protein n=1 Tax=Amedibacterium intestinale TaxID=2583452 RepID=UPI000E1FEF95
MDLLIEGIEQGYVRKTGLVTKMAFDGLTDNYPIYKVRLDCLYFNDRNDRIATWISQYKEENGFQSFDKNNKEKYNDIIQNFITESNPERLKQTQNNIALIGQQKSGVVLKDGRIIDGNRRFSCLRNLSKNDEGFKWFETVILDKNYENNAKQIKMLELQIQIGEEARVDYNPIDRLVGVYRDLVDTKLLTIEEYARSTNDTPNKVKKLMEISKLLVEFLEAINAPGKFYIARDMDLNGPLYELYGILNKIKDEDKKQQTKYIVFTNFLMKPSGDMTRFVRDLKKVTGSNYFEEFIDREEEISEQILDTLGEYEDVNKEVINKVRSKEDVKNQLETTMEIVSNKAKVADTRNKPSQTLLKAISSIQAIDKRLVSKLGEEERLELKDNLDVLDEVIYEIREALNV